MARLATTQYTHPYRFTAGDVETLCRDTGFEIEEMRTYGAFPRNVWRRFPGVLVNSRVAAAAFNAMDGLAERIAKPICQNHAFVARRAP